MEGDFLHSMATSSNAPAGLTDSTFPFRELGCTFSYPYVPTRRGLSPWDPVAIRRSAVSGTVSHGLATSTPSPPSAVQRNSLGLIGLIRCDLVPHSPFPPSSPRQLSSTTTGSLQPRHDPPPWFPYPPPLNVLESACVSFVGQRGGLC